MNQEKFVKEILKKFKMKDCAKVNTLVECRVKMSKNDEGEKINSIIFKSLVGSLRYLTYICPNIIYGVGLVSRFMRHQLWFTFKPWSEFYNTTKGTINFGLFYGYSNSFAIVGYNDSDWAGDMDGIKSTTGFVFYIEDITFTWSSKKQFIITLSTCEAKYITTITCLCHSIWQKRILKELWISHEELIST